MKIRRLTVLVLLSVLTLLIPPGKEVRADTDGFIVHCVDPSNISCDASCDDTHTTIQAGINHAEPGETVLVCPGIYDEQLTITKAITLEGAGAGSTIIKPSSVNANSSSLFSGVAIAAIVLVDAARGVTVRKLTVDGSDAAFNDCSLGPPGYMGIFYRASSGVIQSTHVTEIFHPGARGCNFVLGIFVQSGNGGPRLKSSVIIDDNIVDVYGKNGITANEAGTEVTVTGNTVTGRGPVGEGDTAQNGIQIAFGAHGRVSGNTISDNFYTPPSFAAAGLLFFQAGGGLGTATNNIYSGNEVDISTRGEGPPHVPRP